MSIKNLALPKLKKMNNMGIAHLALPMVAVLLVAVVGTFVAVSKNSDSISKTTASINTAASKKKKKSYVVLYSQGGAYDAAKITLEGADINTHRCGGDFSSNADVNIVKLKKKGGKQIACSAVGGTGQYRVVFMAKGKVVPNGEVIVDVDAADPYGSCTFVHANPTKTRVVPVNKEGKCDGKLAESDTPTKLNTEMRILPSLTKSKKSIGGVVEINAPSQMLTRAQCSGQVKITAKPKGGTTTISYNSALKFKMPQRLQDGFSYCVANLSFKGVKAGTYSFDASFPGNYHLNPVSGSVVDQVTVPASAKKK